VVIADDLVRLYDRKRSGSGLTRQGLGIALAHQGARHLATARGKLKRIYLPDGRQAVPVVVRGWERWSKSTTAQVIAYLVAHSVGGEFVAADPVSELVRLRAERSRLEAAIKSAEKKTLR
jgi:hypothetical protein